MRAAGLATEPDCDSEAAELLVRLAAERGNEGGNGGMLAATGGLITSSLAMGLGLLQALSSSSSASSAAKTGAEAGAETGPGAALSAAEAACAVLPAAAPAAAEYEDAPLGLLQRMIAFKAHVANSPAPSAAAAITSFSSLPASSSGAFTNLGLLSYPVLQAADILLYRATHVPVGQDQAQHLELARTLATALEARLGPGLFPLPATLTSSSAGSGRVMSLRDGLSKMSKSDPRDESRINLDDSDSAIAEKVRAARTDSSTGFGSALQRDAVTGALLSPAKANLLLMLSALSGEAPESVAQRCSNTQAAAFKAELTDALTAELSPIRAELLRLRADPGHVEAVLSKGAQRARLMAADTMQLVRQRAGYE
jgi:tryptophanyl-tRNA synthetase